MTILILKWSRIIAGYYISKGGEFSCKLGMHGEWMLLRRNDNVVTNWEWCQTYATFTDAKVGANFLNNEGAK